VCDHDQNTQLECPGRAQAKNAEAKVTAAAAKHEELGQQLITAAEMLKTKTDAASATAAEKDTENTQLRKQLEAADKTAAKKDDELTQLQEELGAARQDAEKSAADNTAAVARLQLDLQAAQASKAEKEAEQDTQNSHLDTIVCASCFCQRCLLLDSAGASPCFTTCMHEARLGTSLEYLSCCAVRCVTARLPPGL